MENFRSIITKLRSRRSERIAVLAVGTVFILVNFDALVTSFSLATNVIIIATTAVSVLALVCPNGMCREVVCRIGRRLENGDIDDALDRAALRAQRAADRLRGHHRP